jgi:predicted HAD superfamily Cof-like phosphohydrolase
MSNFEDVGEFHRKFGLHRVVHEGGTMPQPITDDLIRFRTAFMLEEIEEFIEASQENYDHAGMFDALLDLVYVAMGTAHLLGYPWETGWDEVQRANMTKQRAAEDGSDSKRKSQWDVIKPPGWKPPAIKEILADRGWEV